MAIEKIAQTSENVTPTRQKTGELLGELLRNRDVLLTDKSGRTLHLQSDGHELRGDQLHVPAIWDLGHKDIETTGQEHELAAAVDGVVVSADTLVATGKSVAFGIYQDGQSKGQAYFPNLQAIDKQPVVDLQLVP